MFPDPRVNAVLARRDALRAAGERPTPEDLCGDCPELLDAVRAALAAVRTRVAEGRAEAAGGGDTWAHSNSGPGQSAGHSIPGYELGAEVGRGGMGVVYRARDLALDREVAVKVLRELFEPDSAPAARFVEEARITAQLQHPGVPAIYHVGRQADGRPFLAMKLIRGDTLDEMRASRAPINVLAIFEAICQAVGYAHAHGVIHRDLKPGNVMVGRFGEVQVMDWGLAKVLTATQESERPESDPEATTVATQIRSQRDTETLAGSVLGTPAFMAPEQAACETDKIGARSDVFGLGAVLCALLTGEPPFSGTEVESVRLNAVRGRTADALTRLDASGAEPGLVELCKRCLAFEPSDRPPDGAAVARAVAELRQAAEERARQAELTRARADVRAKEQAKRRRLLTAAVAVLLVAVVATGYTLVRSDAHRRSAARAQAEEARQRGVAIAQRQKAEEAEAATLADYRASTDEVIEHLLGSKSAPGPQEKAYLEKALTRWQRFAERTGDDEQSRALRAEGLIRVATLRQTLGLHDEAAADFREALSVLQQLADEFPALPRYRQMLAGTHSDFGLLLANRNRTDEASKHYDSALTLRQQLADEFPAVAAHRQGLASIRNNMAILLAGQNKFDQAAEQLALALSVRRQLADDSPGVPAYRYELAELHHNLGTLLKLQKQSDRAAVQYGAALPLYRGLVSEFPAAPRYGQALARTCNNLGILLAEQNKTAGATEQYTEAAALFGKLADEFPAVPSYRIELAGCLLNHGRLVHDRRSPADSLPLFEQAVKALAPISDPALPEARPTLRSAYEARALVYHQLRRYADAVADWDRTIALSTPTEQMRYRARRANSRLRGGAVAEAIGEIAELTKSAGWTTAQWYDFACLYAVASGKDTAKRPEYADRAMELLQKSVTAGFRNATHLAKDSDLDPLRNRADFKQLLESLAAEKK